MIQFKIKKKKMGYKKKNNFQVIILSLNLIVIWKLNLLKKLKIRTKIMLEKEIKN